MIAPLEASMLRQEFPPAAIGKLPKGGTELDFVGPVPGLTVLAKPRTVTPQPDTDAF